MKRRHPGVYDREATAAANFMDLNSYVKRSKDGELLTFLFGPDMTFLRVRAFNRAGGLATFVEREVTVVRDTAFCEMPLTGYRGHPCNRNVTWETAELDHNPSLAQGGDDSLEGVRIICRRCHLARHNRSVRSDRADRREQATEVQAT